MDANVYMAERISKKRLKNGKEEFYVKWKNYPPKCSTWEPAENILDENLIRLFEQQRSQGGSRRKKRKSRRLLQTTEFDSPKPSSDVAPSQSSPAHSVGNHFQASDEGGADPTVNCAPSEVLAQPPTTSTMQSVEKNVVAPVTAGPAYAKVTPRRFRRSKLTKVMKANRRSVPGRPVPAKRRPHLEVPKTTPKFHVLSKPNTDNDLMHSDWTKNEIIITDVKLNSGTVTFTECENADLLFS